MTTEGEPLQAPLRVELLGRLRTALKGLPFVYAVWLEGADAAGWADPWSDIDLWLDVDEGRNEEAFALIRQVLETFGPLNLDEERRHPDPQIRQRFLGSAALSPFWFVDTCIQTHGRDVRFGPRDPALIWTDRSGVIRRSNEPDVVQTLTFEALLRRRWRFRLVEKALRRGDLLEGLAYYHEEVLPVLLLALRLNFCSEKLEYGLKHVHRDLPADVVERLTRLYTRHTLEGLRTGVAETLLWLGELDAGREVPH